MNVDHIKEVAIEPNYKLSGNIGKDTRLTQLEDNLENRATVIHWCPYSQYILIGYQTGSVGLMPFNGGIESSGYKLDFSYLKSNAIHDGEITLIKTFPFTYNTKLMIDPLEGDLSKKIIVTLVGDAHGNLSLWQIYPPR